MIDIGDLGSDPQLVITNGGTGRYLAFSYRWGSPFISSPPLKTTKKTFKQHCRGIPLDMVPRSFLDLFRVARVLGERLIWIDSLCIIQGEIVDHKVGFLLTDY